ncbi:carboxylesterase [Carboxydocella sp. JDF658]|uniref:alpha/beta hydrolase n=1 Tax=Carboxydocella sp. JDF658 TaxID=1926600 RepID=UPI0009D2AC99|nr:alpha/beta fold hydrolase [Carboxydocella sp. JDF658]GAW31385.1 carboxylesterase [Carboxydocella sp. JDF658]
MQITGRPVTPLFFPGNRTGIVLIHGFTGSPGEVEPLGRALAAQGWTVQVPLLPGHGTDVEELARTCWRDWVAAAEKAVVELRQKCDRVYLAGLSMGGLISLYLAHYQPVVGVISLAAPIYLKNKKAYLAPYLRWVRRYAPKERQEDGHYLLTHFNYDHIPLAALVSLLEFIRTARKQLPLVQVPVLLIQGDADETVDPASAEYIFHQLGNREKKLLSLPGGRHLLPLGPQRQQVAEAAIAFINSLEEQSNEGVSRRI